ncbi:MAG TPA: response regulator transcription factor [Pseudonocardia sp.]|uniref:response regulator transcription factor n=1 Tax=Pseudonocardia sp. TaxID=60912 RepID=UPI002B4B4543|nr:response regulator transcription factor [Pseudonocardia sp.]HLU57685.1 response regulator transcription factor [Pseudonocardia sp.]
MPPNTLPPTANHVLLALPPTAASASVLRALRSDGLTVSPVSDGIGVLDAVRTRDPALVVLDVELPGPDQSAVVVAVQNEAPDVPIIAITPRERRLGLLGLLRGDRDDFLVRPFAVDELAARIRLRLRLGPAVENTVLRHGELVVDTEFGDVTVDGRPVSLSPTEYALLMALMAEPGEVVPPHRLAREVWSEPASSNLVQVYISYLRRKIGAERIRTVRGEGYVLEA